ncbi:MAG: hypothetical protein KBD63_05090 [Bacteriovoracaceae bacterium]|nr:hypothetical protein [Bacteriovoracaceae bacterium]
MTCLRHISTHIPAHTYTTEEIINHIEKSWLPIMEQSLQQKVLRLFKSTEIKSRSSVVSLDVVFSNLSFAEKNDLYIIAMKEMGEKVLKKALNEAGWNPCDLDILITTSCTGFMIPSVDSYMVDNLDLRHDILRLPVTEMGCAGGTSGLMYAHHFMKNNPKLKVAVVCLEAPSLTFQKKDFSAENLVSTAIFADGAACALLDGNDTDGLVIEDCASYHFPKSSHLMGYQLQNSGLKIVLDKDVPTEINRHFENILAPFLQKNALDFKSIDHYLFHPGGKKILAAVEKLLHPIGKNVDISKKILAEHGNMSSATVLYIVKEAMDKNYAKGQRGYVLAFGPGFCAQSLLIKWS